MRIQKYAAALFFAAFFSAGPAYSQGKNLQEVENTLRKELATQISTEVRLEAMVEKAYLYQLRPENRGFAKENMRSFLADPRLPSYMAKVLTPIYDARMPPDKFKEAMAELISSIQAKGLSRLNVSRKTEFLQHTLDMTGSLPAATCKNLFLDKISFVEAANLERRYIANLPLAKFQEISLLYRAAVEAELAGDPAQTISEDQSKLAEIALEKAITNRFKGLNNPAMIQRVSRNLAEAPADEACLYFREVAKSMLDLKEPYKSWQLIKFIQSLQ